ncbi:MAG TPA: hypothetical protein VFB90_09025 [Dehalococcoidia bacterium]|nr:hypothetical protein [Dehalococcoidia bacterium]
MAARIEPKEVIHARAVESIARQRFGYPNEKYPHYKTYTNVPARSMGVRLASGAAVYPDIVVVQDPENYVKLLGQVAAFDSVNEDAAEEWATFAELGPLYLYVPVGFVDLAQKLYKRHKVQLVGLRTWREAVGYDDIEITEIFTVPSGPEDMIAPGILKGVLKKLL